ncbi:hypothetical protein [Mangrovicoccus sp. HB161399]|uniref:hypothetical protein n=1 Tax=Mangrovicoccus sp. HB161399 TaxID=2720392 RepID=UPI00155399B6|nr:hypothetical protein [Mangrovicoccus sp. HB161399]
MPRDMEKMVRLPCPEQDQEALFQKSADCRSSVDPESNAIRIKPNFCNYAFHDYQPQPDCAKESKWKSCRISGYWFQVQVLVPS